MVDQTIEPADLGSDTIAMTEKLFRVRFNETENDRGDIKPPVSLLEHCGELPPVVVVGHAGKFGLAVHDGS